MAASTSSVISGTKPELGGGHPRGAWAVLRNSEPGAGYAIQKPSGTSEGKKGS